MAVRFGVSSTVDNRLPRYSNFWDGTAVYNPFSPTGSYDALASYTVGSGGTTTVEFAGLPTGGQYAHLQIRIMGLQASSNDVFIKVNNDNGVYRHYLVGNGTSASAGANANTANGLYLGQTGWNSTSPCVNILDILDYSSTSKYKVFRNLGGIERNTGDTSSRVWFESGLFQVTSAINSVTIYSPSNMAQYTNISVYGVK